MYSYSTEHGTPAADRPFSKGGSAGGWLALVTSRSCVQYSVRSVLIPTMSKFFINRPIVAMVISIIMVIVGGLAIFSLPTAQFPNIADPQIQVQCHLPRRRRADG